MAQEKERGLFASFSQSLFVAQDKVKDRGEDSYLIGFRENAGVCAVFDGIGGSESRQYKEYGDKDCRIPIFVKNNSQVDVFNFVSFCVG